LCALCVPVQLYEIMMMMMMKLRPATTLCALSDITQIKSNTTAGRHLPK